MAIIWAIFIKIGIVVQESSSTLALACIYMGSAGVLINLLLCVLNLIPIPPLDGSRVVSALLPGPWAWRYNQVEPYGIFIVLGLMFLGVLGQVLLPLVNILQSLIYQIVGL
jgi:Zn-dependent protease